MIETKLPPKPPLYPGLRVKFSAQALLNVAPFMADHDIRYYLNGIMVCPRAEGGVFVVGCDGHVMGIMADPTAHVEGLPEGGVIIRVSRGLLSAAAKRKSIMGTPCSVVLTERRLSIAWDFDVEATDFETHVQAGNLFIEGKFPDWRKVLPDFTQLQRAVSDDFNGHLLAKFALPKSGDGRGFSSMRLWQREKNASIVVQRTDVPEFIGVLMPMRDYDDIDKSRAELAKKWPKAAPVEGGAK